MLSITLAGVELDDHHPGNQTTSAVGLGLSVPIELFGLDCALGSRARVEGEIYSRVRREKLFENFSDFVLVLSRAHPKDTTSRFLPENI